MPQTLLAAARYFTPEVADAYVRSIKWGGGACCGKCGSTNVGELKSRRAVQCRERQCRAHTSLIAGTIFQGTHLTLDKWMLAVWQLANCRNGISSCELARAIGCKQTSAWHVLHRVRAVMASANSGERFSGIVEADSTLIGGLIVNMPHRRRNAQRAKSRWTKDNKTIVHAFRERRSGHVRAVVVENETKDAIRALVTETVAPGSFIHTDSANIYTWIGKTDQYQHRFVNHFREEYARGDVTVNGTEGFFNCLRRACRGTYVRPSPEHLNAYLCETVFRYAVRQDSEWDRFDAAMRLIVGKRLTYAALTDGAVR